MASEYPDVVFAKVNIQKAKVRNYKYLTSLKNETKYPYKAKVAHIRLS